MQVAAKATAIATALHFRTTDWFRVRDESRHPPGGSSRVLERCSPISLRRR